MIAWLIVLSFTFIGSIPVMAKKESTKSVNNITTKVEFIAERHGYINYLKSLNLRSSDQTNYAYYTEGQEWPTKIADIYQN